MRRYNAAASWTVLALTCGSIAAHAAGVHAQTGEASVYASRFNGRRMASGEKFKPASDYAASMTLPLGTRAKIIDLKTGRSAVVHIMDRGPHARGRIMDISPKTARELGMLRDGIAWVSVVPLSDAGSSN